MSALPLKADMRELPRNVGFGKLFSAIQAVFRHTGVAEQEIKHE